MIRRCATLLAVVAAATASPLLAEKDPEFAVSKAVKDRPTVALDPAKAYVLLRSNQDGGLYLTKLPSAEDSATWSALRAKAFAKEQRRYARDVARYKSALEQRANGAGASVVVPSKPVAPDEATFEFTPFALMAGVPIGPADRFAKGAGGASTYLTELTPGDYRVYGPVSGRPDVAMVGTCFCLGSVRFTARAGEIVDLGFVDRTPTAEPRIAGDSSRPMGMADVAFFRPAPTTMPLDPRLATLRIVPATFAPAGKAPNFFGIGIGRIAPMPGVFHYERDRMVGEGRP